MSFWKESNIITATHHNNKIWYQKLGGTISHFAKHRSSSTCHKLANCRLALLLQQLNPILAWASSSSSSSSLSHFPAASHSSLLPSLSPSLIHNTTVIPGHRILLQGKHRNWRSFYFRNSLEKSQDVCPHVACLSSFLVRERERDWLCLAVNPNSSNPNPALSLWVSLPSAPLLFFSLSLPLPHRHPGSSYVRAMSDERRCSQSLLLDEIVIVNLRHVYYWCFRDKERSFAFAISAPNNIDASSARLLLVKKNWTRRVNKKTSRLQVLT